MLAPILMKHQALPPRAVLFTSPAGRTSRLFRRGKNCILKILLCISALSVSVWPAAAQTQGILREVWLNIGGATVADLTNNPAFPDNPSFESVLTTAFETPVNAYEQYGQRLRAIITAPQTGNYRFWIASDDAGQLFVSTDATPANRKLVASVSLWTNPGEWTREPSQTSALIPLVAGQRYYIEALMKEGNGGDHLAVRWQLPNGTIEEPIPASRCEPFGVGAPQIAVHPSNVSVTEGGSATFSVSLLRSFGATFQWKKNGVNIPGATSSSYTLSPALVSDSGSTFVCAITNSYGWTNTLPATLTVNPDTTRPTIVNVANLGENTRLTVFYSEPVELASATNASNYSLSHGAQVISAQWAGDDQAVLLETSPLDSGVTYTLTVNDVRDRAATPNAILPDSQAMFSLAITPLDVRYVIGASEPAGPSSRRTALAITEIMYHPTNRVDGRNLEYIEIYNSNPWAEDLSGYRLVGDIGYTFPPGTSIPARSYRVIAPKPADIEAVYSISGVLGPLTNSTPGELDNVLPNGGGAIQLLDELGAILLEVEYDDELHWPVSPDGAGHSLVLARPSYGEGSPKAWAASDRVGGSPGSVETASDNPWRTVLINEVLAHADSPLEDYIELFNYSGSAVDLSGCSLSDNPGVERFVIPPGTSIPAMGRLVFTQTQLGFGLGGDGETIFLKAADGSRVIDALRFDAQENGIALGRYPDGAPKFRRLSERTPGEPNARPLASDVFISELSYHSVTENDDEEFVEIYNSGSAAVNLDGWRLDGGISFTFPSGIVLPAGERLVVARNVATLLQAHPTLNPAKVTGPYSGRLSNSGDIVQLAKAAELISRNANDVLTTNKINVVVDDVTYETGGRWGRWSDGGGSSLERTDSRLHGDLAAAWVDSDESTRSDWTVIEFTGVLDHGAMASADQLQIFLLGAGECLVDNVEVLTQNGVNLVTNGTFTTGTDGWFMQGTHEDSRWQATGGFSGGCLRVVASDRGDNGANRIRTVLSQTLNPGSTATIRARVRWLTGHPEILLRLRGNWLEATGPILTTRALGTPAAPNSYTSTNTGPSIASVSHWPVLPQAGQTVTVTAQIEDPDGLAAAALKYRIDPGTNYISVPLVNRGAGFYSATIPAQSAGTMVAFYLEAFDGSSVPLMQRFPSDAPVRECLVRFGEPSGLAMIGQYRVWVTEKNIERWKTREKQSNHPLDATFIYGGVRVCYNIGTLYSGSPWHTPGFSGPLEGSCDYELNLAKDDPVLGATDFVLATPGNLNTDFGYQAEQAAFWIGRKLGTPYLHRRHIQVFMNGQKRGNIYEDAQQPNRSVISQYYPEDKDGSFHKVEDWFEFDDSGDNRTGNVDATLQNFTTTGGAKKTARYRWNWRPRGVRESANDFTNLFALVDALHTAKPEPYRSRVMSLMDVDEWMRVLATERIVGNWDSYGYDRGKNMYAYKPNNGSWRLFLWDLDFVFNVGGDPANTALFGGHDPLMNELRAFPEFQRLYWRAFEDAVNGPLNPATFAARVDAIHSGLTLAGVGPEAPTLQGMKDYVTARRNHILSQLQTVAAGFSVQGATTFATNKNLITISGTAPVTAAYITVNGLAVQPVWTSVTNWTLRIALQPGVNNLTIEGWNNKGQLITGGSVLLSVTFTGVAEPAEGRIVFNEIMYRPAVADGEFVEIHNVATNTAYDLSGWRIAGLDHTIADGTILEPGGFLVFVKDMEEFWRIYGDSIPIAGVFGGTFVKGTKTLQLIQPGATPAEDVIIDQVTFDDAEPWPAEADGMGPSLQLVDPLRDNNRVANWDVGGKAVAPPPSEVLVNWDKVWRYNQTQNLNGQNWKVAGYNDLSWQSGAGVLAAEDCNCLPEPIRTQLITANGRITYYFRTSFDYTGSLAGVSLKLTSLIDDGVAVYLNGQRIWSQRLSDNPVYATLSSGTVVDAVLESSPLLDGSLLQPGLNVLAAEVHQSAANSTDIVFGLKVETDFSSLTNVAAYTPGAPNSIRASLPEFPTLWLNELLPVNSLAVNNPIADRFGEYEPWVELFNGGTNAISLADFHLTTNYNEPTLWKFPADATIQPGEFKIVWLDGEPGESTDTEWHTSFRLDSLNGSLALVQVADGKTNILDYMNFAVPSVGRSYGDFPDGDVSGRRHFSTITPGAANSAGSGGVQLFINEWLADNVSTLADPADGGYEDWFEIYNAGDSPVDLGGYYLTDNLGDKFKFQVPANGQYVVPPNGYLLVWADNESNQNSPGRADLHADFALSKGGEALGLFSPEGNLIDAVTFGPQTTDQTEGRFPDGSGNIVVLTTPTPRAANYLEQQNSPPTLDPLPNRNVDEGTLLTFTATATDANVPAQTLTFSLDPGAPAGAAISADGVFTWTPSEEQGPGSYPISVRVTDNGVPPMDDVKAFTVTVLEVNQAPQLGLIDNAVLYAGQTLRITNSAFDVDIPQQELTFDLMDAPSGMTIDPSNGVLVWRPVIAQGNTTNSVTVRVTDSGSPGLTDTRTFTATVFAPSTPVLLSPLFDGQQFGFTVSGTFGPDYVIERSSALNPLKWIPVFTNLSPALPFSWSTPMSADDEKNFYRIRLAP